MNRTNIAWSQWSSNPIYAVTEDGLKGHACVHASPGCLHCYSEAINLRGRGFGTKLPYNVKSLDKIRFEISEKELEAWKRRNIFLGKRRLPNELVFVEDMSDLFGIWVSDEKLNRIFSTMENCQKLTFQILTKQSARMRQYLSDRWKMIPPPANIWVGVSVENQQWAENRMIHLLTTPAYFKFVSAEPLLGPIDFTPWLFEIGWLIIGGESGKNRRPCELVWIDEIVGQCLRYRTKVFIKQDSTLRPGQQGRIPDRLWALKEIPQH